MFEWQPLAPQLRMLVLGLLVTVASCQEPENKPIFTSDVVYDTVAVVGGLDETNPLFLYSNIQAALLDDSTVVYSDAGVGGRMVVANLINGEGWERQSGPEAEGPGEFGGKTPLVYPHGDVIHTITPDGWVYNSWTRDGGLLASHQFDPPWTVDRAMHYAIYGIAGGHIVSVYSERPDYLEGTQSLRQGIRVYDIDRGIIADIRDSIPILVVRGVRQPDNTITYTSVSGDGLKVHGRGNTIVWIRRRERGVTTLDAEGRILTSRELDYRILNVFVDADERIWARVAARDEEGMFGNIVLDRELNELFRVAAMTVWDASGDAMLAFEVDELDAWQMVLLKMRNE